MISKNLDNHGNMVGSEVQKSLSWMVIKFDTLIRYYIVKLYKCLIEMNSISVNHTMLCGSKDKSCWVVQNKYKWKIIWVHFTMIMLWYQSNLLRLVIQKRLFTMLLLSVKMMLRFLNWHVSLPWWPKIKWLVRVYLMILTASHRD